MRPWLFLKHHGIAFSEAPVPLGDEATRLVALAGASPSGLVPALHDTHRGVVVWDSLAIFEYLAGASSSELFAQKEGLVTTDSAALAGWRGDTRRDVPRDASLARGGACARARTRRRGGYAQRHVRRAAALAF